jgi:ATP-dependent Lhr-like helicase
VGPLKSTPLAILPRRQLVDWLSIAADCGQQPGGVALRVLEYLARNGASFFEDIAADNGLLRTQTEEALGELASLGRVTCDSFAGMRALLLPSGKRRPLNASRRSRAPTALEDVGRWDLVRGRQSAAAASLEHEPARLEAVALTLVKRYGVVFRENIRVVQD